MVTATKTRAKKAEAPTLDGAASRLVRKNFGNGHAYYLDGVKLDGVTTLMGDGMRKAALENWAGNVTAEYAVDNWAELQNMAPSARLNTLKKARFSVRDEAARRGSEVHELADQISNGREVLVPDEIAGYVTSAVRFLDDWQIRPILSETSCYSIKGMYGGTLDGVATSAVWDEKCGEKRVILFDWKTNRTGIYGETALQLAGYANADAYVGDDGLDHPMAELGITDHWAVWVRSDGYDVYPMDNSEDTYRTFQYVATVARRTGGKDKPLDRLKGDALYVPGGTR
ncbi:hypothetical protein [Subtercola sp. YIM 133946]|uniref:hypothetical protein n=1 Tax=Subtercola sp. YIM 133946 TaxID=3118909 RepID=UPI002F945044